MEVMMIFAGFRWGVENLGTTKGEAQVCVGSRGHIHLHRHERGTWLGDESSQLRNSAVLVEQTSLSSLAGSVGSRRRRLTRLLAEW